MPSSYTTSLRFEKQFTGENVNTWGDKLSAMLDRADDAVAGYVAVPLTGATYTVLSANSNIAPDEARRAILKFTGALSGICTVTIPAVSKLYWVWNAANYPLVITTGSGSTVTLDAGDMTQLFCDGTNVRTITFGTYDLKTYIGTIAASAGAVPGVAGHAGKFLYTDGASAYWKALLIPDINDYATQIIGKQIALAVAL